MESMLYKKGEAAGELKGERKIVTLQLETRLEADAGRFVARLASCTENQLEALSRLLVGRQPNEDLIAELERLLPGS